MKSWYHDKSYIFQTTFAFYRILKLLGHMFEGMIHEQELQIFHPFFGYGLTWDFMMWISFFCFIITLCKIIAVKFDLFSKIRFHEIKKLNIAKGPKKKPKSNLESHVQYEDTHESCKGRMNFFWTPLPCAWNKTHGKAK